MTTALSLLVLEITIIQSCVKVSAVIQGLVKGEYTLLAVTTCRVIIKERYELMDNQQINQK